MKSKLGKRLTRFRAAAVDIDGTLKGGAQVSSANVTAVQALQRAGLMVFPATGRIFQQALPYYRSAGLNGPLVTSDGAVVRGANRKLVMKQPLRRDVAADVRALGSALNLTTFSHLNSGVCVTTRAHWNDGCQLHLDELKDKLQFKKPEAIGRMETFFMILYAPKDVLDKAERIARTLFTVNEVNMTRYGHESLHFTAPGVTKVHGLQKVCEMYGFAPSELVAFGDSRNDVEMLEWAGLGVAMFHGTDAAKAAADIVAYSPNVEVDFAAGVESFLTSL